MTLSTDIAEILALDEKRAQFIDNDSKYWRCVFLEARDVQADFYAAAPRMVSIIRILQERERIAKEALQFYANANDRTLGIYDTEFKYSGIAYGKRARETLKLLETDDA